MFTKVISLAFLFLVLSCTNQNGFINFDIEATGGHRLTVQIPLDSFLSEILDGYSDPGLRKTLETCGNPNTTPPFEYFKALANTAQTNDYDIVKYFNLANPVLFLKDSDLEELQSTLENEYQMYINDAIDIYNTKLASREIRHNIYRSEFGQMIIEVSTITDLELVKSAILQKVDESLVISETLTLMDVLTNIVLIDSIHSEKRSDAKQGWFLFDNKLEVPTTIVDKDQYGGFELRINSHDAVIGKVEDSDTAFVGDILRKSDTLFPDETRFAWLEEQQINDNDKDYFLLFCLRVGGNSMIGKDLDSVKVVDYEEYAQVSIRLIFNETGTKKWSDLTASNLTKTLAITIGSEILCAPIVQGRIDGGICDISGQFDLAGANSLADRIRSTIFPFTFYTVAEEVIQAK